MRLTFYSALFLKAFVDFLIGMSGEIEKLSSNFSKLTGMWRQSWHFRVINHLRLERPRSQRNGKLAS